MVLMKIWENNRGTEIYCSLATDVSIKAIFTTRAAIPVQGFQIQLYGCGSEKDQEHATNKNC